VKQVTKRKVITWGEFKKRMEQEGRGDNYKILISGHMSEREFQKIVKLAKAR
jgi:hypothetical protein